MSPEPLAHLEPVDPRQHDVEHDEVGFVSREPVECLLTVPRGDDAKALPLERIGQQLLNRVLVVDEQNGGGIGIRTACQDDRYLTAYLL